jgi:hypothetical protein
MSAKSLIILVIVGWALALVIILAKKQPPRLESFDVLLQESETVNNVLGR